MASTDEQILDTLQKMLAAMQGGSLAGGNFSKKTKTNTEKFAESKKDPVKDAADRQRLEKAMNEGTKALKDAFKSQANYGRDAKLAGAMFQQAVGKLNLKGFDELPKRISALTKDIGLQFQTKADIDKALNRYSVQNIDAAKRLHESWLNMEAGSKEFNQALDQMTKMWGKDIDQLAKSHDQLAQDGEKFHKAIVKETIAIEQAAKANQTAAKAGTILAEILGYVGYQMLDATRASAKFGVEILPLAKDMKILGMSADELAEIQNKNVQAIRGAGVSFGDFDDMLISGAYQLAAFTGSMRDGAIIFGDAFRNFRMLSTSTKDQNKFITDTAKVYKFMHDTVGTTAQQFQELTSQLMSNTEVQVNMYRLNERQRTQAFQELLTQNALLKTYGLLEPEAQAVVQTFAQIGAQGPKERLKQAAQLQAVGGALGMGAQARQLAEFIRKGDTQNPDAIRLAHELQVGAQKQYANVKGTAGEFAQYALTNIPGVQQILGQAGPVAALGTRQGVATPQAKVNEAQNKAQGKMSKEDQIRQTVVTAVVTIGDQVKGIKTLLEVIAATLALPTFTGLLKKVFSGGLGRLGSILRGGAAAEGALGAEGAAATAGAAGAGSVGLLAGGAGVAIAGAAGYGAGKLLDMVPELFGGKDISEYAADVLEKWDPLNKMQKNSTTAASVHNQYDKSKQVHALMEKYDKSEGDQRQQQALLEQLDALTSELAKMSGKDPTKAIEDMHRTLKQHHQEDKEMTQEQTDAVKKNKGVVMKKSSTPIGPTA